MNFDPASLEVVAVVVVGVGALPGTWAETDNLVSAAIAWVARKGVDVGVVAGFGVSAGVVVGAGAGAVGAGAGVVVGGGADVGADAGAGAGVAVAVAVAAEAEAAVAVAVAAFANHLPLGENSCLNQIAL